MGAALADASRAAKDVFDEVDEALGQNLFRLMREGPDEELKLTENAQPAIMAHSIAVLRTMGVRLADVASFVAGHSLGEYSALVRGGLVRPRDDREAAEAARAGDAAGGAGRRGRDGGAARRGPRACAEDRRRRGARRGLHRRQRQRSLAGRDLRPEERDRPRDRDRQGHGRQARRPAAGLRAVPLPADAARGRGDARCAVLCRRRAAGGAALRQCHRAARDRPRHDPQPARRAGHRNGPLARERRQHVRCRRARVRRDRRQGARVDGQAHRARREGDERGHDRGHRGAAAKEICLAAR